MGDIAIQATKLGKRYRLGRSASTQNFRERLTHLMGAPFRAARSALRPSNERAAGRQDHIWALRDVSFTVGQGEVIGVIGRNGAGKSTLLKVLTRITEPTEGEAIVRGRVGSLLEVGTGFHPELTGRENIYLNGAIMGMKRAETGRKFDQIVAFAEVAKFIDTPVKRYSSGMYLRLAFAVAAHLEPEVLLVDEVLAVGDTAFQRKCLGRMGDVANEGRTVLFVSHNMAAVRKLCKSALLIDEGRVVCHGRTGDVVDTYIAGAQPSGDGTGAHLARNEALDLTLRGIDLLDGKGQVVPALQVGQPATIRLRLETSRRHESLLGAITVSTMEDLGIYLFHTRVSGFQCAVAPPGVNIDCTLPKLPLRPGRYRLGVKCGVGGKVAFFLPYAQEVDVVSGDFYGNGRLPDDDWTGVCLAEHTWRAVPVPV